MINRNKIIKFIEKYRSKILIIAIGAWIYSLIHEIVHGLTVSYFGYEFYIKFYILFFKVNFIGLETNPFSPTALFYIAFSPYLFNILISSLLLFLIQIYKKKLFFYLSLLPLIDTITNFIFIPLAILLKESNDFVVLFNFSQYHLIFALIPIFLVVYQVLIFLKIKSSLLQ